MLLTDFGTSSWTAHLSIDVDWNLFSERLHGFTKLQTRYDGTITKANLPKRFPAESGIFWVRFQKKSRGIWLTVASKDLLAVPLCLLGSGLVQVVSQESFAIVRGLVKNRSVGIDNHDPS